MCCSVTIEPVFPQLAIDLLAIGLFVPVAGDWHRMIEEEQVEVLAKILDNNRLKLSLSPGISTDANHLGKRIAAGVYFEMAAKLAEKMNGRVVQHSNVGQCRTEAGNWDRLLAAYPETPLLWERVCPGFRALLMEGFPLE